MPAPGSRRSRQEPGVENMLETCAGAFSRERPGHGRRPPGRDAGGSAYPSEVLTPRRRIWRRMDRLTQGFKEASGAESLTTIVAIQVLILSLCRTLLERDSDSHQRQMLPLVGVIWATASTLVRRGKPPPTVIGCDSDPEQQQERITRTSHQDLVDECRHGRLQHFGDMAQAGDELQRR